MNKFELFFFDLDGTLTESRSNLDNEMGYIIKQLLDLKKIVVISGADFSQFQKQFIKFLPSTSKLKNLYIAPLTGGSFYVFKNGEWKKVYEDFLTKEERKKIIVALKKRIEENKFFNPKKVFGVQIQDRGGQITFSALGDKAPIKMKKVWDSNLKKRKFFKKLLDKDLPEFEISIGGTTSIDIRKKGIDKAYGINKISSLLKIPKEKIIFLGDAIFKGGNDYSAISTGVHIQKVSSSEETKEILKKYLQLIN